MATWVLESIEVAGGFLAGLSLQFPGQAGLICIIGPRGSGKSTLVEAIRYGMGEPTASLKARASLAEANLLSSVVTIRTLDKNNVAHQVIRRSRQPAVITKSDGQLLKDVDLERGTFLPLDAYSSAEIEAIAEESLGEKRRLLIDTLQGPQYGDLLLRLSDLRRGLEANADKIRDARRREKDLTERIEELKGARDKLDALPTIDASDNDGKQLKSASEQLSYNKREAQVMGGVIAQYGRLASAVSQLEQDHLAALRSVQPISESENRGILEHAMLSVQKSASDAKTLLRELLQIISRGSEELLALSQNLSDVHQAQETAFQNLQGKNAELTQRLQQRSEAEQAVAALSEAEATREDTRNTIADLLHERVEQKGTYLLERGNISMGREAIAKQLESGLGKRVRLRVLRNADNMAYKTMLLDALRGARLRNHDEIIAALLQIRPEQLAEIISNNDIRELDVHADLGEERCRKILDAFRININPFALETIDIEDRIAIELNVGTALDVNFKDAAELSRGQKCTALLPLLLARRETPLVIDQPEDNLDNHFIYETVVNTIRRLRSKRQMIFVTHNANIPVLGEADLVVVMNSDGRRGYVSKVGSVDDCRSEIVELLEGGREAFDKRRQRYER